MNESDVVIAAESGHRLRPRGSNHVGMRQFNERVVLQAIRLHGALPKADIARLTHLTPQTVQLIVGRLEADGLVERRPAVRGRVGQPSVPMALNPDGAYSIGVKLGRRSLDVLLVDFVGQVRQRRTLAYDFPQPQAVLDEIRLGLAAFHRTLGPGGVARLHGLGIAAPLSLGGWQALLGVRDEDARRWDAFDLRGQVAALTELPVTVVKDTAAACVAELVAGRGRSIRSFLYVFVDTFVGGGLVVDSHLHGGLHGNAGAIGSMPLGLAAQGAGSAPPQLLGTASLWTLERAYAAAGLASGAWSDERSLQSPWREHTEAWIADAAPALALAGHAAACLLDFDGVIVDGSFSRPLLAQLLDAVHAAGDRYSWEGVSRPPVLPGTVGSDARALGGALLPLYADFAPDRDLFLKIAP